MHKKHKLVSALVAIAAAVALAACGSLDADDLEGQLADSSQLGLADLDVTVDCPDDQDVEEGNEFTCTATENDSDQTVDIQVTLTNDDGAFEAMLVPSSAGG